MERMTLSWVATLSFPRRCDDRGKNRAVIHPPSLALWSAALALGLFEAGRTLIVIFILVGKI